MGEPNWFRTSRHGPAEEKVRQAIMLIAEARTILTIWEFEQFVRDNITSLGSHGFVASIGEAMIKGATIEHRTPIGDGR